VYGSPSFTNVSFLTVNDRDATLSADAKNAAMAMRYSVRNANVAPNQDVRGSSEVSGIVRGAFSGGGLRTSLSPTFLARAIPDTTKGSSEGNVMWSSRGGPAE
jgi:hypothetical protein